ncbi:MAG: GNAT family N-acetyltransferase [Bacteroidota bacterium]|nr:GNAT family N-acetyltransferase [Bacteroidota bacterium]
MLYATTVSNKDEIHQIHALNQKNLRQNLTPCIQKEEGFVSWLYSIELLEKMHHLAPSVIIKDGDIVAGYALTTLKESAEFHPDLQIVFQNLQKLQLNNQPIFNYRFYCMGQICISKEYRGKGLVNMLYQKHKEIYYKEYDFILTDIATRNSRSMKSHQKIGFKTIHSYVDNIDEWDVVIWDWK